MKLRISDDLTLDAKFIVSTAGIFASKGMGKSHVAQVMAEEMLAQGQVIIAIDPTDAWYGLRSSADGKSEGYPVVVIGGEHGDLPLEPGGAVKLAEAIVEKRFSCIICTDGLSDMAEAKFVREFLDTIYRKNRKPLHIFVDEADIFAPQKPFDPEDARCIRAMSHIVRRGRRKGIGSTLITQRPAELNASVRTMVEMLFVLGMLNNLDIEAVEKWMRLRKKKKGNNAGYVLQEVMIESLDTLQNGDAWVWAPRLKLHKQFRARAKRTFDSGATPKPGQKIKAPKKLAPVDLKRLGDAMAAAVQRQKENDPTELRKQVAALRKELAQGGKGQDRTQENAKAHHAENVELRTHVAKLEKRLEKKLTGGGIKPADIARVEKIVSRAESLLGEQEAAATRKQQALGEGLDRYRKTLTEVSTAITASITTLRDKLAQKPEIVASFEPAKRGKDLEAAVTRSSAGNAVKMSEKVPASNDAQVKDSSLQAVHLRLLSAIAWWESLGVPAPDLGGVAFAAGTSATSGGFNNNRSRLRAAGYIEYPSTGRVALTDAGRALAPPPSLPPTNEAYQEAVLARLQPVHRRLLTSLIAAYPNELPLEELARQAGTSATSGGFNNNRSWLRSRGLAEYPRTGHVRAAPLLFPESA